MSAGADRAPATAPPPGPADSGRPLLRLWTYAARHRRTVIWATVLSTLNKVFDVAPEILIGAAVDVVVRGDGAVVSQVVGIEDRWAQLVFLAILNAVVWLLESLTERGYSIVWRNLAQTVEHEARMTPTRTCSGWSWPTSRTSPPAG